MEDKRRIENLQEILDKKIVDLNKKREEINQQIAENEKKYVTVDGKLQESEEVKKYRIDLSKINAEIQATILEKQFVQESVRKTENFDKETEQAKKDIKNLEKNSKECEEVINELKRKYIYVNGKMQKPKELLEYEEDLKKITQEISEKSNILKNKEMEYNDANTEIQKLLDKYQVKQKESEEIEQEETEQEETEPEEIEPEEIELEEIEPEVIEPEVIEPEVIELEETEQEETEPEEIEQEETEPEEIEQEETEPEEIEPEETEPEEIEQEENEQEETEPEEIEPEVIEPEVIELEETEPEETEPEEIEPEEIKKIKPEEAEEIEPEYNTIFSYIEGRNRYLNDKKLKDLDPSRGIKNFAIEEESEDRNRAKRISEITCMTKLGLYAIKLDDGTIEYFDAKKAGFVSKKDENEAKEYLTMAQNGPEGMDLNIPFILYDTYGTNELADKTIDDYKNGWQHFSIVYDDTIKYKDYKKMLAESSMTDIDEKSKLKKLSLKEKRYFKNIAKKAVESGLKVSSVVDTRSILEKIKDVLTLKKLVGETSYDEQRANLEEEKLDNLKRHRNMENPEIIETKEEMEYYSKAKKYCPEIIEKKFYKGFDNGLVYTNTKQKVEEKFSTPHSKFVQELAESAARKAVDKRTEEVIKKVNKDMGINMPATKEDKSKSTER